MKTFFLSHMLLSFFKNYHKCSCSIWQTKISVIKTYYAFIFTIIYKNISMYQYLSIFNIEIVIHWNVFQNVLSKMSSSITNLFRLIPKFSRQNYGHMAAARILASRDLSLSSSVLANPNMINVTPVRGFSKVSILSFSQFGPIPAMSDVQHKTSDFGTSCSCSSFWRWCFIAKDVRSWTYSFSVRRATMGKMKHIRLALGWLWLRLSAQTKSWRQKLDLLLLYKTRRLNFCTNLFFFIF